MRKIILYIATSLNGKIARPDGGVDWLDAIPNPEKTDYGYAVFYDSIDTIIMGHNTYQLILDWGIKFTYPEKKNYVLTRKQHVSDNEDVTFVKDNPIEFTKALKNLQGKDIWLVGGGQVNTLFFNAGLIDEIQLFVMPIVIPEGIDLFEKIPIEKQMKLLGTKSYSSGVVELKYSLLFKI